ncbi:MAG: 3-hydroxyisobutyrate dehydrogenase [Alphaproteobacteria bacterium]|jgi:3-hydroxyisobutyrate dehydrogenase|nr:3-hydroxyisobutyrate dehydrogenase [Alphaproteobacteria bacterium]
MARIGFIGVGNMGGPMSANLSKAQHQVRAFDLSPEAVAAAEAAGATAAPTVAEAVKDAEIVVTMLPAGAHVREVYMGEEGIFANAPKGTLFIDSSTIDVATSREVAAAADAAGFAMLDAPVSGGTGGAEGGTLTFMVGGDADAFERGAKAFDAMGKTIVHCGSAGAGQAVKACNNMMLAISMIGVAEGFNLADALGIDRQIVYNVCSTATASSWALNTYCPVPGPAPASPANRGYQAGFTADMMLKDLRLAQDAAQKAGVSTPLGSEAQALFALFSNMGSGAKDFSGIIEMLRGKA